MFVHTPVTLLLATAALAQIPTFGSFERNHFTPDPGPTRMVATADLDGDGDLDALFFGTTPQGYRNDGHAVFTAVPLQLPNLPLLPADILIGDIDGDGDNDLFLISADSPFGNTAMLLRNQGNFTFTVDAQPVFAPWDRLLPQSVDVDGDGDLDCLGWGHLRNSITRFFVFRNDGTGTFTDVSAQAFPDSSVTPSLIHYAIADFDRNGRADIVFTSTTGLDLLRCDGSGVFRREAAESGHVIYGIVSGDLDADGYPDLLVDAAPGPFVLPVMRRAANDRTGHFTVDDGHEVIATATTSAARLVDLDADGRADLLLPRGVWHHGYGSAFGAAQYLPMVFDLGQLSITDLNGDLLPDLLGAGAHPRLLLGTDRIAVDRAARDSTVGEPVYPARVLDRRESPASTILAQLHDNRLQYVIIDHSYPGQHPRLRASSASLSGPLVGASVGEFARSNGFDLWPDTGLVWTDGALHLGFFGGDQVFEQPGALPDPGAPVLAIRAGRLLRDDFDDITVAIGTPAQPSLLVYSLFGSSYRKFTFALPPNSGGRGLHLADVDGDGDLDVICGTAVLRHDLAALVPMFDLGPLLGGQELLPFDMDGDGDADLITSRGQLLESTPAGYRDVTLGRVPPGTQLINPSAGDIDGDGDLDIMASNGVVLRNDGRQFTRFVGVLHAGALIDLNENGEASVFDVNELWFGGHNRIHAPLLPQLGADYELRITTWREHAAATLAVVLLGSALDNAHWPQAQIALATAQPVALALTGGDGAARMRVPPAMALYGTRFYLQAVIFDGTSAQPTNVLAEQIR